MCIHILQVTVGDTTLTVDDTWSPAQPIITPVVDGEEYSLQVKSHDATGAMQLQFRGTVVSNCIPADKWAISIQTGDTWYMTKQ